MRLSTTQIMTRSLASMLLLSAVSLPSAQARRVFARGDNAVGGAYASQGQYGSRAGARFLGSNQGAGASTGSWAGPQGELSTAPAVALLNAESEHFTKEVSTQQDLREQRRPANRATSITRKQEPARQRHQSMPLVAVASSTATQETQTIRKDKVSNRRSTQSTRATTT